MHRSSPSLRSLAQLSHHGDVAEDDGGEGEDELKRTKRSRRDLNIKNYRAKRMSLYLVGSWLLFVNLLLEGYVSTKQEVAKSKPYANSFSGLCIMVAIVLFTRSSFG